MGRPPFRPRIIFRPQPTPTVSNRVDAQAIMKRFLTKISAVVFVAALFAPTFTQAANKKPNILIIWGDDIGWNNPSCYHRGLMGYERADHEASDYGRWRVDHAFVLVPAQAKVRQFLQTFKEYPPRQKPGSSNLDQVLETLTNGPRTN
jgi:hypothetical protein